MIPLLGAALLAGGCQLSAASLTDWAGTKEEPAAAAPIPAEHHLDAGIARFTGELTEEEKQQGENFARVRVAETLYLPQQLRQAMLRGGGWRNVWVIPARALTDVRVEAEILASDGSEMKLAVRAVDATGDVWLQRTYEHEFSAEDYAEKAAGRPTDALFDRIAADLLAARDRRGEAGLREIRSVAELRFAREFVPGAFARHLSEADGRARLVGLPARGDTTYQLTLQLKERDDRFLETAQGYAQDFAARIDDPYRDWARRATSSAPRATSSSPRAGSRACSARWPSPAAWPWRPTAATPRRGSSARCWSPAAPTACTTPTRTTSPPRSTTPRCRSSGSRSAWRWSRRWWRWRTARAP